MGKKNKTKKNIQEEEETKQETEEVKHFDTSSLVLTLNYDSIENSEKKEKNKPKKRRKNSCGHAPGECIKHGQISDESEESKAREDMEIWEKLLGIRNESVEPVEEIQRKVEKERERFRSINKDREYTELKTLSKKHKKIERDVDNIFHDKRTRQGDKLGQFYNAVIKAINENLKLREQLAEEKYRNDKTGKMIDMKIHDIQKVRKQKDMLYSLFQSLKEIGINSYIQKDVAIQEQQDANKEMNKKFDSEIEKVTNSYRNQTDIKTMYENKKKELDALAEEHKKIEKQSSQTIENKEKKIMSLQDQITKMIEKDLK